MSATTRVAPARGFNTGSGRRSTQMIVIGAAVLIIGIALVYLATQDRSSAPSKPAAAAADTAAAAGATQATVQTSSALGFAIPAGKQAVAVDVPGAAGLAGYAKRGSLVNIYALVKDTHDMTVTARGTARRTGPTTGVFTGTTNGTGDSPVSKLILANIQVLDVKMSGSNGTTLMLALDPAQTEKLLLFAKFESIWAVLANADQGKVTTSGTDIPTALKVR